MKSPFPGMDPYLERFWRDVHARFNIYACDRIQEQLPGGLRCRVEERVVLESDEGPERSLYPDVRVMERPNGRSRPRETSGGGTAVLAPPIRMHVPQEPLTETYLEVVDVATGNRVITVIEVMSPSNKLPGDGQRAYLNKKRDLLVAQVSLVEIDLLRQGVRFYPLPNWEHPDLPRTHYQIVIRRGWEPQTVDVYPIGLTEPLPTIPIPLRPGDAEAILELQPILERCYANGRYAEDIDYRYPPEPSLEGPDAAWLDEFLKAAGKR